MFRHSCGVCHFCNTHRPSDITIADFWGWQKTDPEFNKDDKGVSLVLVNTEKGRKLWEAVRDDMDWFPANLEDCMQPNLQHPSIIHPKRIEFEEYYVKFGIETAYKKFLSTPWYIKCYKWLKNKCVKVIKKKRTKK